MCRKKSECIAFASPRSVTGLQSSRQSQPIKCKIETNRGLVAQAVAWFLNRAPIGSYYIIISFDWSYLLSLNIIQLRNNRFLRQTKTRDM